MDTERVLAWPFQDVVQTYTASDTMFYALSVGVGLGTEPLDEYQLRHVYESELMTLPTQAVVLGHPGPWGADPSLGIDGPRVLYAQQHARLYRPLPAAGTVRAREKVVALVDKGHDKGALMVLERRIVDHNSGEPLATLQATVMCRGDGGSGVAVGVIAPPSALPVRAPDRRVEMPTLLGQALLYRLNGDMNPIHADPALARRLGFERPILHGLCSYAIAGRALIDLWCNHDAMRLRSLGARFTAPLYPGETLVIESWRDGERLWFRGLCKERGVKVLDSGTAEITILQGDQP